MKSTTPATKKTSTNKCALHTVGPQEQPCKMGSHSGICNRIIQNAKPSICFYSHTPEGVFTFLSPSAKMIFGFTPEAGVGKNWRDIL